jgi:hypothetical protein
MTARCPVLIPVDDGFEERILLKTMREAAIASRGSMTFVEGFDGRGTTPGRTSAWVASRKAGEIRISVFPNSIRIRRKTGERWNSVDIDTHDHVPVTSADRHRRNDDAFKEAARVIALVAESLRSHIKDGVCPDVSRLESMCDRIVGDAKYHAAAANGHLPDCVGSMRYALATPFAPARAVASCRTSHNQRCRLDEGDLAMPKETTRGWAEMEPFLFVTKGNRNVPDAPRSWALSAWQFTTGVEPMDPVTCLRLLSGMTDRLAKDLEPLL